MNGLPRPRRTLRNEITRHILAEGYVLVDYMQDATFAVDALRDFVLVFGPEALIEAL